VHIKLISAWNKIKKIRSKSPDRHKTNGVQLLLALLLIGVGIMVFLIFLHRQQSALKSPAGMAGAPSVHKPSRNEVDAYNVPLDQPKYLTMPSIHVPKTRIINLGVTGDNQIASPGNLFDAGWYQKSAKPGQAGAMFIYGHVSSWQSDGLFKDLSKLKQGDKVYIIRGDNKQFEYTVVASKVYPRDQVDMSAVLSPFNNQQSGLNLMTCAGNVIKGANDFTERLVVFTKLTKS
jgi:LPXTG-site transpeptidase (sortase) family protein